MGVESYMAKSSKVRFGRGQKGLEPCHIEKHSSAYVSRHHLLAAAHLMFPADVPS